MATKLSFDGLKLMLYTRLDEPLRVDCPHPVEDCLTELKRVAPEERKIGQPRYTLSLMEGSAGAYIFSLQKRDFRAPPVKIMGGIAPSDSKNTQIHILAADADVSGTFWIIVALEIGILILMLIEGFSETLLILMPVVIPPLALLGVIGAKYHQEVTVQMMQSALCKSDFESE